MAQLQGKAITLRLREAHFNKSLAGIVDGAARKLAPHLDRRGDAFQNLVICASELVRNATKERGQYPVTVRLKLNNDGFCSCVVLESKPFEFKKPELPEDIMSPTGRGMFLVEALTGGALRVDGKRGISIFTMRLPVSEEISQ